VEDVVGEVRRRLHHAPGVAPWADAPTFAEIDDEVAVPTFVTPARSGTPTATPIPPPVAASNSLTLSGVWRWLDSRRFAASARTRQEKPQIEPDGLRGSKGTTWRREPGECKQGLIDRESSMWCLAGVMPSHFFSSFALTALASTDTDLSCWPCKF
jgi:hypothetical protein